LPISYEYNELETGVGTLEITYDNLDFPHSIVIDLETKEGTILEAGVAIAGSAITFEDPLNGVREGLIDYSIRRELSNGAWYIKNEILYEDSHLNLQKKEIQIFIPLCMKLFCFMVFNQWHGAFQKTNQHEIRGICNAGKHARGSP